MTLPLSSDNTLLRQLEQLAPLSAQVALLQSHAGQIDDAFIDGLKGRADQHLRADREAALNDVALLYQAAALTGNPLHRALALFADANVAAIGGLGDYPRAIDCCNEAAAIYGHAMRPVDQADAQVTKIFALAMLGRYEEALDAGTSAATILTTHEEWLRLATILMNLAIVYGRMGRDREALAHFDRAGELYTTAGEEGLWSLPGVAMNRALVLRNLGRFGESLTANRAAIQQLFDLGQHAEVGHAQQTMAFTYYTLGHYNEALALLDATERIFTEDGRAADLLITALYRDHCLLEMQRYAAVIAHSDAVAALAARLQQPFEEGYVLFNKALAYAGLQHDSQAFDLLTAAHAIFVNVGNAVWGAEVDLLAARLLLNMGRIAAAHHRTSQAIAQFSAHQLPVHTIRAHLLAAEILLASGDSVAAGQLLALTESAISHEEVPSLAYRSAHLAGRLAETHGEGHTALAHYDRALTQVERLRGRLMVEHRSDFLADKAALYHRAIRLALTLGQPAAAYTYADRARSRALHDLLTLRIDLRIQPQNPADEALVAELNRLRQARDHHYRRALHANEFAAVVTLPTDPTVQATPLLALEEQIATLWQTLLVRNADYARTRSLDLDWAPATANNSASPFDEQYLARLQAQLPPETLLISYYLSDERVTIFAVTSATVKAMVLPAAIPQLQRLIDLLRLNIGMAAASDAARLPSLTSHAQKILYQLYQLLLAPMQAELADRQALVIVPHGLLHYLPFHALVTQLDSQHVDQSRYLLDDYAISYLPSAAFLQPVDAQPALSTDWIALSHSYGGQLLHTRTEVEAIGALTDATVLIEEQATKAQLTTLAPQARLLHLATHGDFRADNPLFSGLALADGWLSTLDIFELRTHASLVTLSACQTGRSVIGGGDELLGLTRAFLAAGAASLVLTLWSVHDASTAALMGHFYRALLTGVPKNRALQHAQIALRNAQTHNGNLGPYSHPYFWAPFLLTGDNGPL